MSGILQFFRLLSGSVRDLLPIILVILFFQAIILLQIPSEQREVVLAALIPQLFSIASGILFVLIGLTFFVFGLETGLFPLGEAMAYAFARKGSLFWLLVFAFALGFGTTIAEPALIAVADEAARVAAGGGIIPDTETSHTRYASGLRVTVAMSVGVAIMIGVLRILKGWPVQYLIMGGYIGVVLMTMIAPKFIIGIAYDSGGVTTSTITVPLVTALGVGLASSIKGRNPMIDGFGLIAFASLTPMIFVMLYGVLMQ